MTHAKDTSPTRRLMKGKYDDYVVELSERTIRIRPPRTKRDGPAEVTIDVGPLYQRLLLQKGR